MLGLAPLHDCARRIGAEPAALFDEVAAGATQQLAALLRHFGRRDDVIPEVFGGFALVDRADGPAYVWT